MSRSNVGSASSAFCLMAKISSHTPDICSAPKSSNPITYHYNRLVYSTLSLYINSLQLYIIIFVTFGTNLHTLIKQRWFTKWLAIPFTERAIDDGWMHNCIRVHQCGREEIGKKLQLWVECCCLFTRVRITAHPGVKRSGPVVIYKH